MSICYMRCMLLDILGVLCIGLLLPDKDDAVIWRGPRKNGLIKQFLKVPQLLSHLELSVPGYRKSTCPGRHCCCLALHEMHAAQA